MHYKKSLLLVACTALLELTAGCVIRVVAKQRWSYAFVDSGLVLVFLLTLLLFVVVLVVNKKDAGQDADRVFQKYERLEDEVRERRRKKKSSADD